MAGDQLPELKLSSFSELDKRSMSATMVKHIKYLVGREASKMSKWEKFFSFLHKLACFFVTYYLDTLQKLKTRVAAKIFVLFFREIVLEFRVTPNQNLGEIFAIS